MFSGQYTAGGQIKERIVSAALGKGVRECLCSLWAIGIDALSVPPAALSPAFSETEKTPVMSVGASLTLITLTVKTLS